MTVIKSQSIVDDDEDFYPSGDGKPMAETPIHVAAIMLLFQALQDFFRNRQDVYLSANSFWYWEEGNPKARCAPDTMFVPGVEQKIRRSFMSWQENGAVPAVIIEVCSKKTWRNNLNNKPQLYAELGVKEYFLFDPEARYIRPPLLGFRLNGANYTPLALDSEDRLFSEQLNLFLKAEKENLRLIDAATGEPILFRHERIEKEHEQAELAKQQAEQAKQQAEQERQQAEQAKQQAEQERQRAATLEAEVARLQALLQKAQNGKETGPAD